MKTRTKFRVWLLLCAALPCALPAQQVPADAPYLNPKLPIEQRVNDLIARMTLEEKISQLGHTATSIPRLHVPEYNWWNEGLHGVARAGYARPAAACRASTWSSRTGPARSCQTARSQSGPRPGVPRPSATTTAKPWAASHCEVRQAPRAASTR